jgi:hypothetical protein
MVTFVPPKKVQRRAGKARPVFPAPPALTLVAAAYQPGEWVRLTFDRAVDVASADTAAVRVDDGAVAGWLFRGDGPAALVGPRTVQVGLAILDRPAGSGTRLSAGAGTGIVAADDGGAWPGVTDLSLPFP